MEPSEHSFQCHVLSGATQRARELRRSKTLNSSTSAEFETRVGLGLATTDERLEHLCKHFSANASLDFRLRMLVAKIIMSNPFEWTFGFIVLAQLVIAAAETDYNAMSMTLPVWVYYVQFAFVATYVFELTLRIYVWRKHFFLNNGNRFDLTVVALDLGALIAENVYEGDIPSVAILRCVRMLKLVRTARVLKQFRELYVIAYSLAGVLKSIFWESVVLFVVLTLASIVAVEIIHPINLELAMDGTYDGCDRCPRAFENVMQSNLTFFQGMVAGDSWGLVIIPIIERRPETAIFFVFLTLLVVLGLMNLILSAIVDKATSVRHIVEATSLLEKRAVIEQSKLKLVSVCEELDIDKNGILTKDELEKAISTPEFQQALKVMDLGPDDLDTIFGMMDADSSDAIEYEELADSLQRIKAQDDHMLLLLIQRTLKDCYKKLMSQLDIQSKMQKELAEQKSHLQHLGQLVEEEEETLKQVVESDGLFVASGDTESVLGHCADGMNPRRAVSRRRKLRLSAPESTGDGEVESVTAAVSGKSSGKSRSNGQLSRNGAESVRTEPAVRIVNIGAVGLSDSAVEFLDVAQRPQDRRFTSVSL